MLPWRTRIHSDQDNTANKTFSRSGLVDVRSYGIYHLRMGNGLLLTRLGSSEWLGVIRKRREPPAQSPTVVGQNGN